MKIPAAIVLIIIAAIAGYLAADGVAYSFAKKHGVRKYGGIFQFTPPNGLRPLSGSEEKK